MNKLKLIALFCSPSTLSAALTLISAFVLLLLSNFTFLQRSNLVYELIFSHSSSPDLIQASNSAFSELNQIVFGNALLNKILFFGLWMLIGLVVYAIITTLAESIASTEKEVESLSYVHARKVLIEKALFTRLAIRGLSLLTGLIYLWAFMRYLFPYCVFAARIGLNELRDMTGWLYLALGFIVLLAVLHGFVIIMRLMTLRARIFGVETA